MRQLTIQNVGPIQKAVMALNRVNVFIGPQSSGKSTIAKIISFCTWVEKDIATHLSLKDYNGTSLFIDKLVSFHKMQGYIQTDSTIEYTSEVLTIKYAQGKTVVKWVDKYSYNRNKISYIPAERNMVILPEMEKMELLNNNIRSFLFDWFNARKTYPKDSALNILSLPVSYYYDTKSGSHVKANNYDILLDNASSGLQSLIPLITIVEYLTEWIYNQDVELSFEEQEQRTKISQIISIEKVIMPFFNKKKFSGKEEIQELHKQVSELLEKDDPRIIELVKDWAQTRQNFFTTSKTNLIIEEPEQNLFPSAQVDLVYYLLDKCLNGKHDHVLTLTTHSPYILYALNNCMLASKVVDKMPKKSQDELCCKKLSVDSNAISVYKILDGEIFNIQEKDGLIGSNFFDDVMKDIMDDYYSMLNYYDNE